MPHDSAGLPAGRCIYSSALGSYAAIEKWKNGGVLCAN